MLKDVFVRDALFALRQMALQSPRSQADLDVAMTRAGLPPVPLKDRPELLKKLQETSYIQDIITLGDGGTLVTVYRR